MLQENTNPTIKIPRSIHKIFKGWKLGFIHAGVNKKLSAADIDVFRVIKKSVKTKKLSFIDSLEIFYFVSITIQKYIDVHHLVGGPFCIKRQKELAEEAIFVFDFLSENKDGLVG